MNNIIRSLFYSYKKKSLSSKVFVCCLLTVLLQLVLMLIFEENMSAGYFAVNNIPSNSFIVNIFIIVNTAFICTDDFGDKTVNYEILTGHTRLEVFGGRLIMSLITGVIGVFLIHLIPVLICTAICGWGTDISPSAMLLRGLLMIFPIMRIICEAVFLCFVIRKPIGVMGFGIFFNIFILTLSQDAAVTDSVFLATTNLNGVFCFHPWITYGLRTDAFYTSYDSFIDLKYILQTLTASAGFGMLFCLAGYGFFRQDDIE